jgi:PAS domain S-box-containing protein
VEGQERRPLLVGVVIDVTERRSTALALRQATERAALAARAAGLGTWELALRDGRSYWDEQMWRLRGLEPQDEPPDAKARLAIVYPDDRAELQRQIDESLARNEPATYEFRIVLPDGRVRWLASRSALVRDEQGQAVSRIGVNWDITDGRTAEAVRHERELALRESRAKSAFLARMSHELRTPLNAVLGFTQLLLQDGATDAEAATRRLRLEVIRSAGRHLLALIDDVLDLTSLDSGGMRMTIVPVRLAPLVAEMLPLLEPLQRERRVTLAVGALDFPILADATRLRQVLLNLLTNAVKYNRDGGHVTVDAEQQGGQVVLRVADTGRGMSDEQQRHLFEPFNRLGIESEGIEGTGIGLVIVKSLVERMGGSLRFESAPGVGTLFEVRLPCADDAGEPPTAATAQPSENLPVAAASTPAESPAAARRGTLLYVEDNPVNALIMEELVARRPDLRLHIAVDGTSGVARAIELRPDLVLLDMQLPDFDGHEVLRRLRADPRTAGIPCIAVSANAMPEDIERALRAGIADYWTKPLDFRAFLAALDALFGPADA